MQENLIAHIRKFIPLTDEEAGKICGRTREKICTKKEILLKEGARCQEMYFIADGCLRLYVMNDNGSEQTIQFGIENWWLSDFTILGTSERSGFCIQAVERTEILVLSVADQEFLLHSVPRLERYFRIIMQKAYAASLMRFHYLFDMSGEERYRHFSNAFPGFVQKVPQYMLASYLGFTPEFLSKIRAKKK